MASDTRLLRFVVTRSWTSNPLRTVLTCLGVALGIAIVVAIHVVDHNTIQSRIRQMRPDFGRVDLELVPLDGGRTPEQVRAALSRIDDIAAIGILHTGRTVAVGAGDAWAQVELFGLAPLPATAFSHYTLAEGEDLSDLDGDATVLLAPDLAARLGAQPGSTLSLLPPRVAPVARCKDGVLVPVADGGAGEQQHAPVSVRVKGILARTGLARRNLGDVVIGSFALARQLAPAARTLYQVNLAYGANPDRARHTLAEQFEVLDDRSAMLGEAADERAFRNGVKVLGCLALVLGMFVVFQTLSQSLVERLKQIGLLRCLGATRRTIAGIFLLDALLSSVIGAVLGVGFGIGLAALLQNAGFTTLGVGKEVDTFQVPPLPVAWTAALGVLFTLAGASFPLLKARNLSPLRVLGAHGLEEGRGADVLRGVNLFLFVLLVLVLPGAYLAMTPMVSDRGRETLIVLGQLGAMILLFGGVLLVAPRVVAALGTLVLRPLRRRLRLPAFLVAKALRQSGGRFAASVCGLSVVLLALLALEHITDALRGEVKQFGALAMDGKLFLEPDAITPAKAHELAAIAGVQDVTALEGRVSAPFLMSGIDLDELTGQGGVLEAHPDAWRRWNESRTAIVSRRLATLRGLEPGAKLNVLTDDGPVAYEVLLVSDEVGFFPSERAYAVTAPRWLRHDFCVPKESVGHVILTLAPGARWDAVLAEVRNRLPQVPRAKSGDDITAYLLRDVTRDFVLFEVLLGLILALAGVGLVNQMTIAALGRTRELGVLRALGMGRGDLRAMFLLEGWVIAATSALLALALGVPLGAVVVNGLNRVAGLDAPLVVPWRWFASVPVLALAVGLLAAAIPAWRAGRESPAEAVRYE